MSDLTWRLGPLQMKNPVLASASELTMTAAGIRACLDAGAAAVVAKSINENPAGATQLDIADYALLDDGLRTRPWPQASGTETLFNRSGLAQTVVDEWVAVLAELQRHATSLDAHVIGSVTVAGIDGAAELCNRMSAVVPAVEVNVGAPHGREAGAVSLVSAADTVRDYVRAVRAATPGVLIVKLPGQGADILEMATAAVEEGADAISLIGRLNGFIPDLDTWDPVLGSWGAVGGPWMLPATLYWVSKCYRRLGAQVPIIGTNGARSGLDVARFLLSGAHGVEFASLPLVKGPQALTTVLADLDAYLRGHDVLAITDMIGESVRRAREYSEIVPLDPRPQPWRDLVPNIPDVS